MLQEWIKLEIVTQLCAVLNWVRLFYIVTIEILILDDYHVLPSSLNTSKARSLLTIEAI